MSETVTLNGVTHHAPLLVCRPVRPEDYPPDRLGIWDLVKAELGADLSIRAGSIFVPCEDCGITVALGPRQQATVEQTDALGLASHVVCMIDATVRAIAP